MKKPVRIISYVFGIIFIFFLAIYLFLVIKSPGIPRPFPDKEGKKKIESIAVIETIKINGLDQRMIIRGQDTNKPVLLYLHGGPGSPEFPFFRQFNSRMEDMFVVCYWDQPGAGLSYSADIPPEHMTLSQFVEDAADISRYLIRKFKREKIYLMGHSWGSILGSFTVNKYPELFNAFFSIGQVAQQERSEIISYNFVLSKATESKDKKAIADLKKIGPPPYSDSGTALKNLLIERKYVTRYGGAIKQGKFYKAAISSLINCREYTLKDKINYIKGMKFSLNYFWGTVGKSDLFHDIPSQQIPIYIMQGTSDYQTAYVVAKEYFDTLKAPVKRFYSFENSAHSPIFEEPLKFEEILKDIIIERKAK